MVDLVHARAKVELEANDLFDNGSFVEALSKYRNALEIEKTSSGYVFVANTLSLLNRNSEALEYYELALKAEPNVLLQVPILLTIGKLQNLFEHVDLAMESLQQVVTIALNQMPYEYAAAHLELARCRMIQDDTSRALEHYQEAVAVMDDSRQLAKVLNVGLVDHSYHQ